MPYVSESKGIRGGSFAPFFEPVQGSRVTYPPQLIDERQDYQYGWRSTGEREASYEALSAFQATSQWSDTRDIVAAMDRVERSMTDPLIRDPSTQKVNDRDMRKYVSLDATPVTRLSVSGTRIGTFTPILRTFIQNIPTPQTESFIRTKGGSLLRRSRPTSPASNLTQWFGELRQFGSGFQVPTRIPESVWRKPGLRGEIARLRQGGKATGSAYLAGQFGWIPFFSEIFNALEVVANSESVINQFLRDSGRLTKRSRTEVLHNKATASAETIMGSGGTTGWKRTTQTLDGVSYQNRFFKPLGYNNYRYSVKNTVVRKETVRAGALWEYFAADPDRVLGRLSEYSQQARILLGDPLLSASTLYELAPWSWLVDWHFDFGSLLSFQESVANDSLVARRSFVVWEAEYSVISHWAPAPRPGYEYAGGVGISHSTWRLQKRFAGSPYDMGIDWSGYTGQQWFILGALGLTKAPGKKL